MDTLEKDRRGGRKKDEQKSERRGESGVARDTLLPGQKLQRKTSQKGRHELTIWH
ncbi:hypothetical protein BDV36DRAFT_247067 [Aspergillus pseudocaelatus]|uniref:Small EDRK-rich factor-like N-terminal domain-containing protein n=1 Tax=Aspergillus pseudocaelatus TaxID=1825620 RepID=A0ABQ6X1D8_9EURO|nr:hypothetical protein BDV36DRAFT_247067 [Aspergillus pseudocaelatus]